MDRTARSPWLQRVLERPRAFWWLMLPLTAFLLLVAAAASLALSATSVSRLHQIQLLGLDTTGRQLRAELSRHVEEVHGLMRDPDMATLLHGLPDDPSLRDHLRQEFEEALRRTPHLRSLTWVDEDGRPRLGLLNGPVPAPRLPLPEHVSQSHAAAQTLGAGQAAMLAARAPGGAAGGATLVVPLVISLVHVDGHPHGHVLAEIDATAFLDKLAAENVFGSRTAMLDAQGRWLKPTDALEHGLAPTGQPRLWQRLREPRGQWRDGLTLWAWTRVDFSGPAPEEGRAALAAAPEWIVVSRVDPQVIRRFAAGHALLVLPVVALLLGVLGLAMRSLVDHAQRLARTQRGLDLANRDAGIGLWSLDLLDHRITMSGVGDGPSGSRTLAMTDFLALVPDPGQRARLTQAIDQAVLGDAPRQAEVELLRPDGTRVWRRLVGHRETEDGLPVRLTGTAQDITSLKQRERELAEERARLIDVVDGTQAGLWTWRVDTGAVRLNDYYAALLGLQPGEAGDRDTDFATWVRHVHPDDVDGAMTLARECLEGRVPTFETQMRLVDTRGGVLWVHNRARVTRRDAEGRPLLMSGVVTNVTDLVSARHQAEAASQAKSEFLSTMSHELRTPLNAILGFGQLLSVSPRLDEDQRDNVGEILSAGQHLLALINDVLDLSRIESGRVPLQIAPVDVAALVRGSVAFVAPMAQSRGIRVHVQVPPDLTVTADATRLRQVLVNLLSNAVKYNHDGGEVAVTAQAQGARLSLTVADTGPGIGEADRATLFQPFQRGAAAQGPVPGTGIGLSIARGLLQRMGGELRLDSPPGQGCVFHLGLPLRGEDVSPPRGEALRDAAGVATGGGPATDAAPSPDGAPPAPAAAGGASVPDEDPRIDVLCVDDNPANLKVLERMLASREDLNVRCASSAALALLLVRERRPDLVLTDLHMPGTDGFALLRRLREEAATREVPVVAVSASAMSAEVDRGLRAGFDDYLTKPLDIERVLATVARLTGPDAQRGTAKGVGR